MKNKFEKELRFRWIKELLEIPSFADRCRMISNLVKEIYKSEKVLLFFHSENRHRYTVPTFIGLSKRTRSRFDFFHEDLVINNNNSNNNSRDSVSYNLDEWPWFDIDLKNVMKKYGLQRILPFWYGKECLGGVVFQSNLQWPSKECLLFESAAVDFGYLLEISFIDKLHRRSEWEKKVILEVGKKTSELFELDDLLNHIIDSIKEVIDYDAAGIFLIKQPENELEVNVVRGYSENSIKKTHLKVGKGLVGWTIKNSKELNIPDVRKDSRYIDARKNTRSQLSIPIIYSGRVIGAFAIESNRYHFFRHHDVELMRTFAAQTAIVLENSKLLIQAIKAIQMQQELEIAKGIQDALLPKVLPKREGFDFSAVTKSSREIGGDLYDFITLSENELGIAIGDISGKGVPGALLMATLYASFRGFVRRSVPPNRVIRRLNRYMYKQTEADKFATLFYGTLNCADSTFTYTNAGHNAPILVRSNGKAVELKKGGPLLGFVEEANYLKDKVVLNEGDIIFLFTDGISEAQNTNEEEFGENRIIKYLKNHKDSSAEEIIKNLLDEIKKFTNESHQSDDLTMVVIKRIKSGKN
ncbi:SpoIIE family protein phosphatase [candidate division KSB1 bacterium]